METKYKFNNAADAEIIHVILSQDKFPIFFKQKVDELIEEFNLTEEEARKQVEGMEFTLELCYQQGSGLFAIETEAIEQSGNNLFNPYTGEHIEECDEAYGIG